MDPWIATGESVKIKIVEIFEKSFEDNFVDFLPDSKEYIAILEAKLKKLKSSSSVIKQLQDKKEACMRELLNEVSNIGNYQNFEDSYLEEEIQSLSILRTIAPEKRALSKGEIIEFIKYDQFNSSEREEVDPIQESRT